MPNWCYINLEFEGPESEIKSILESNLDFDAIFPTPMELLRLPEETSDEIKRMMISKYGSSDWYSWRVTNWGTKWPVGDDLHKEIIQINSTRFEARIVTAWSLPTGVLKRLSSLHPQTTITMVDCEEEAGFFVGGYKILNGSIIEDTVHEPTRTELLERGLICEEDE
jgi:hypothetical protein